MFMTRLLVDRAEVCGAGSVFDVAGLLAHVLFHFTLVLTALVIVLIVGLTTIDLGLTDLGTDFLTHVAGILTIGRLGGQGRQQEQPARIRVPRVRWRNEFSDMGLPR